MKKFVNWLIDVARGAAIGIACIIPGVSGGTMAVLTKCYDKLIGAISTLFKNFVKSFLILLPLGVGIIIGVAVGYLGVRAAFTYILFSIVALFFGLILGSVPSISEEVRGKPVKKSYIITFVISLVFVLGIALTSFLINLNAGYSVANLFADPKWYLYVLMIPVGVIGSFALVTPGISGSMLLLVIGFYKPILDTIHDLVHGGNIGSNIGLLACFIVGIILGFFFISKLMKYLLDKHRVITFYAILGFIIGSLPALFLNVDIWYGNADGYAGIISNPVELALGIPLLIAGALVTYFVLRLLDKKEEVKECQD